MQSETSQRYQYWILVFALCSFLPTLFLPYIGEEGVYTISSYEMWYNHQFLYPIQYGGAYWRPPFFNWLIIPLANLLGWPYMLVATRCVTALATTSTGLLVGYLGSRLFKEKGFGLFAMLVYLTSDALLYHGWLAYADPLFAFLIFAAITALWVSNLEQRYAFIGWAALAITAALSAFMLIAAQTGRHAFILKPVNVGIQLLILGFPLLWKICTQGITGSGMVHDITRSFSTVPDFGAYFKQNIFFPFKVAARFLPASALAVYFWLRNRVKAPQFKPKHVFVLILLVALNIIPYWVSPQKASRYLLPLYPFISLWLANVLWRAKATDFKRCLNWLMVAVLLKYIWILLLGFWQMYYHGNYVSVAKQVIKQTQGKPLYVNDDGAIGLSVTAHIDTLRYPDPPLQYAASAKESDYFTVGHPDPALGNIYATFPLGRSHHKLYLLCKGKICKD
jgi:hypothetical protein